VVDDLVQAPCLRAIERADQHIPGTRVDRWLCSPFFGRSGSMRFGRGGFVKAVASSSRKDALTIDGVA
jgi:RNA polymerase sigma-70 factor (ECF subfamily)